MELFKKITPALFFIFAMNINMSTFAFELIKGKNEVKIADWNGSSFDYYFPSGIKSLIQQTLYDSLGIGGTVDSVKISDPEPHNSASIPYLEYFISNHGQQTYFLHRIVKRLNGTTNIWEFFLTTDLPEEMEEDGARVVKCTSIENCNGCRKVRTGFLGLGGVIECPCTNNESIYCDFESTSGFPWEAVIGAIAVIIAALL